MNDLQLLKMAAKAAGYNINFDEPINDFYPHGYLETGDVYAWWNPLKDDGDAWRLALDIKVAVEPSRLFNQVAASYWDGSQWQVMKEVIGDNIHLAARKVIVRVAAYIGERT